MILRIISIPNFLKLAFDILSQIKNNDSDDEPIEWEIEFLNENNEILKYTIAINSDNEKRIFYVEKEEYSIRKVGSSKQNIVL